MSREDNTINGERVSAPDPSFIIAEYQEAANNVRESWQHITTLVRQFILLQILMISLVGLGNAAVSSIITTNTYKTIIRNVDGERGTLQEKVTLEEKNLKRTQRLARSTSLIVLIGIGIVSAWGVLLQCRRIFLHAEEFVRRAAAIERKYGVGDIPFKGKVVWPQHVYMDTRLNPTETETQNLIKMQRVLDWVFKGAIFTWVLIAFLYAGYFLLPIE